MAESNTAADERLDREHLRLLSIFYYAKAGLAALGGCIGLVWMAAVFGMMAIAAAAPPAENAPPQDALPALAGMTLFVGCVGMLILSFSLISVALLALTGWWLSKCRYRTFCMVIAALECTSFPLGTVLGVFTIIVLSRPSVRAMFDRRAESPRPSNAACATT